MSTRKKQSRRFKKYICTFIYSFLSPCVPVGVSNSNTFSWKCTRKTGTFLPVYTGTFLTVCRKSKVDGWTSTVKIPGIVFVIFDPFLSNFCQTYQNFLKILPKILPKCQKYTVNFWHIPSNVKNVENITEFLTYTGTFWSLRKFFDLFLQKSKAEKGLLSCGRLLTVNNIWLLTFNFREIPKISAKLTLFYLTKPTSKRLFWFEKQNNALHLLFNIPCFNYKGWTETWQKLD